MGAREPKITPYAFVRAGLPGSRGKCTASPERGLRRGLRPHAVPTPAMADSPPNRIGPEGIVTRFPPFALLTHPEVVRTAKEPFSGTHLSPFEGVSLPGPQNTRSLFLGVVFSPPGLSGSTAAA